jgi:GT2 family glycosyltransferase
MKDISFVTNTGPNTLEYTKLLLESLKTNLVSKQHEIIVFIDKDNDGTYDYLKSIKNEFYDLKIITHKLQGPVGYQRNSNLLVDIAKHDIVSYIQSDMVIGPHYDTYILNELKENMILSATRVEPPLHGYSDYTITYDFGTDPLDFDMEKWNAYSAIVKTSKEAEYFFAPITFYKKVWQSIGGYDTIFRRSREDSDFVQRAVQSGIRLIQTWQANVYHFTCVSSRGKNWFDENNKQAQKKLEFQKIADGIEIRRFLKKWGSFNHGEQKLKKLDIDLVIKDSRDLNPLFVSQLEVYSSRVWVQSEDYLNLIIKVFNNEQDPANELLGYTKENWEEVKHLFRTTDFSNIYKVGEPTEFNIKIEIDFTNIDPNEDQFLHNITRLSDILEGYEPGIYELGSAKIEIRNIVDVTQDQIVVINPSFDYSLLTIE